MSLYEIRFINAAGQPGAWQPDYVEFTASAAFSDVGGITLTYAGLPASDEDMELCVTKDGVEIPDCRFLLDIDESDEAPSEEGKKTTYTGRTAVWAWLDDGIVYPPDGSKVKASQTIYGTANAGQIMKDLIVKMQARGAGVLIDHSSFDATHDSNGQPWSLAALNISYDTGVSLLQVLQNLVGQGIVEVRCDGRSLKLFNPDTLSVDRTLTDPPVVLRAGRDINEAPRKRNNRELTNVVLVRGENDVLQERTSAASLAARRRRESSVSQGGVSDPGTLAVIGDQELKLKSDPLIQKTFGLKFSPQSPQPWGDYTNGDYVFTDVNTTAGLVRYRVRQIALTQKGDGSPPELAVVLNDKLAEAEIKINRKVAGITGGATLGGGSSAVPAPTVTSAKDTLAPKAPATVSVGSASYVTSDGGTLAQATFSWTQVTQNADNTAISDLGGYEVQYATTAGQWVAGGRTDASTTVAYASALPTGSNIYARVRAFDTNGNYSGWTTSPGGITATDLTPPPVPSQPVIDAASFFGAFRVSWDGKGSAGQPMDPDFARLEVHVSQVNNFAPSIDPATTTLVDYITSPFGGMTAFPVLTNGPTYVKFVSVDRTGNRSAASAQASATGRQAVSQDILDGAINSLDIADAAVTSAKVAVDAINATHIAANAVGTSEIADAAVATAKLTDAAVSTAKLQDNAVAQAKLAAGSVIAAKTALAAIDPTSGNLTANSVAANNIAAGAVTTEKMTVGMMTDSVLLNGNFKDVSQSDPTMAAKWQRVASVTGIVDMDFSNQISVGACMRLRAGVGGDQNAYLVPSDVISVVPGDIWYLTCKVKGSAAMAGGYFRFWMFNSSVTISAGFKDFDVTTGVTTCEMQFTIPAGMTDLWPVIMVKAGATPGVDVFVDDVMLTKVVVSARIADGAITTPKLIAGAVTAEKLTIGSMGDSLIANGGFEDTGLPTANNVEAGSLNAACWSAKDAMSYTEPSTRGSGARTAVLHATGPGQETYITSDFIPVNKSSTYFFACRAAQTSATSVGGFYARVHWYDTNKNFIGYNDFASNATPVTDTGGGITAGFSGQLTTPANAGYCNVRFYNSGPSGDTYFAVDDVVVRAVVVSALIADGAITSPKIVAGSVTSEKLTVGSLGDNLVRNFNFGDPTVGSDNPALWNDSSSGGGDIYREVSNTHPGGTAVVLHANGPGQSARTQSDMFPVVPGAMYYFEAAMAKWSGAGAPNGFFRVGWYTAYHDLTYLSDGDVAGVGYNDVMGSYNPSAVDSARNIIGWQWQAPADARYCRVIFYNFQPTGNSFLYVNNVRAQRVTVSAQIADGAITTPKLVADAVTAGKISADAITAREIQAGAVNTAEIAAGAITAASAILADAVVLNAKIADLAVNDAKISDLNVGKITAGSLTAAVIIGTGSIKTATSGLRAEMTPNGFYHYNSGGAEDFGADSSGVRIAGTFYSGTTAGNRIAMGPAVTYGGFPAIIFDNGLGLSLANGIVNPASGRIQVVGGMSGKNAYVDLNTPAGLLDLGFNGIGGNIRLLGNGINFMVGEVAGRVTVASTWYMGEASTVGNTASPHFVASSASFRAGVSSTGVFNVQQMNLVTTFRPVYASAFTVNSTEGSKTNVKKHSYKTADLKKIRAVSFKRKEEKAYRLGVVAEEVAAAFPEIAAYHPEDIAGTDIKAGDLFGVDLNGLVSVLLAALQEQGDRLDALEAAKK